MWHTCIFQSKKDRSFFVGHTNDLNKHLAAHNAGSFPKTVKKAPWTLVYSEVAPNKTMAIRREGEILRQKRKSYMLDLINGGRKRR
jgi:putative endonuclease